MGDKEKELELLKQLPAQRRIELLEDRVADLESLLGQSWEQASIINHIADNIQKAIAPDESDLFKSGSSNRTEEVLSVDEGLKKLTACFKEVHSILNRISIKDANYSPYFIKQMNNAFITVAMIKALGIGEEAEHYLDAVKKLTTDWMTADSKV